MTIQQSILLAIYELLSDVQDAIDVIQQLRLPVHSIAVMTGSTQYTCHTPVYVTFYRGGVENLRCSMENATQLFSLLTQRLNEEQFKVCRRKLMKGYYLLAVQGNLMAVEDAQTVLNKTMISSPLIIIEPRIQQ